MLRLVQIIKICRLELFGQAICRDEFERVVIQGLLEKNNKGRHFIDYVKIQRAYQYNSR